MLLHTNTLPCIRTLSAFMGLCTVQDLAFCGARWCGDGSQANLVLRPDFCSEGRYGGGCTAHDKARPIRDDWGT